MRYYDRSRSVQDWKCPRSRFWQYEYGGRGIVPGTTPLELYLGTTLHDGLAAIGMQHLQGGVDIDLIATTAFQQTYQSLVDQASGEPEFEAIQFAKEQATLVEGLLRGFHAYVWPTLMEAYPKILAVEQEMTYTTGNFTFMAKPDLVVEDAEGSPFYVEYKSTSSKKPEWVNSWNTAVQLHSTLKAIEETLGVKPVGVVVAGLYKGYVAYGKQTSPMCWAYYRKGSPPFQEEAYSYDYKQGYKKVPTWELPGGVKGWVDGMPQEVLAEQFPMSPPIFVKDDMIEAFFQQRRMREAEISLALDMLHNTEDEESKVGIMNVTFPQRFDQCVPSFGKPCPYRQLCFGPPVDPLEQGYSWRESHHKPEADAQTLKEESCQV